MSDKTAIYCNKCDGIYPCPVTGSEGNWYWSDEQRIHYRKRVRQCSKCQTSFSTYEINHASFIDLLNSDAAVERHKRQASEVITNIANQLDLLNVQLGVPLPLLSNYEDEIEDETPLLSLVESADGERDEI